MNQHNNSFQHGRLCRGVEQQQEQKQDPKISQLFESMRRKDDPNFLAEKNPPHREPKLRGDTTTLQMQMKPKMTTKSKKLVPVRKKQPKAKNGKMQQRSSATIPVAAKKPPSPSASPENAQKVSPTPNIINASSKEELDMAASVMMELTLAPPPSLPKIHPIGTRTKKFFKEFHGWFQGTIRSYNQDTKFYSVEYEDGDTEELEHNEIDTGSLPPHKYDIGTQYEIYLFSKHSGKKIGWFVGQVRSKYYNDPKYGNRYNRKTWRYNVVYSDGDSEDVDEAYITQTIEESKQKRGNHVVESPVKIFKEEQESHQEDSNKQTDESYSEEEEEDEQEDSNPENIPYWTGKQHHQFLVGLQKYGLGNLEDIHEANCIPDRSFQELVRYWEWYASDMEEKGLALNYGRRGTVNGKKGSREGIQEDSITEEEKDDTYAKERKEEPHHETNAAGFYTGIWTDKEKEMVAKAFVFQGSSYKAMSDYMKTRSAEQISSYYNKNKKKIVETSKKYADEVPLFVPPVRRGSKNNVKADSTKMKSWTPGEHDLLVEAVAIYGKKSKEIETYMKCRKQKQILGYLSRQQGSIEKEIQNKKQYLKKKFPKKTNTWTSSELSMLVEGHAIFQNDYERIADYVKTRSEAQVKSLLEANPSRYEDESAFDLGDHFSFPIELYHVLNVAPFESFDHIISWNDKGDCVLIHDNGESYQMEEAMICVCIGVVSQRSSFLVLFYFSLFTVVEFSNTVFPRYTHKGTPLQKFYDNLELFGFESHKDKRSKADEAFCQSEFQKEDYKKVEQHCRKAHIGA